MKKYVICAALLCTALSAQAQVGIGTTKPSASAMLDITVKDGDKGILIPRVSLTSITDYGLFDAVNEAGKPENVSMLVYNTNGSLTSGGVLQGVGFFYWSGSSWQKIVNLNEVTKIIKEEVDGSGQSITNIQQLIDNYFVNNKFLTETSVVLYDFTKEEFYTLIRDDKGDIVQSDVIDLGPVIRKFETNTFIRTVTKSDGKGGQVPTGYYYFSETAIKDFIKTASAADAKDYITKIPNSAGVYIDIIGTVTHNFEEIIEGNKEYITNIINNLKGNVTIKVEGDVTYLTYIDENGNEVKIDISNLDTNTFIRTVTKSDGKGGQVPTGYYYFDEKAIKDYIKTASIADAKDYINKMPNSLGTYIDIIGTVSNNFEEIIEGNKEYITNIINNLKGNVTIKVEGDVTYLTYIDENGNEVKIDISNLDTNTFVRTVTKSDGKGGEVPTGYYYFNEKAIKDYIKTASIADAKDYMNKMPNSLGTYIDIVGTVSNNFQEIIEENKEYITNVINNLAGNVTIKVNPVTQEVTFVYNVIENGTTVVKEFVIGDLETNTFIRSVQNATTNKVTGYLYFSEKAISDWKKGKAKADADKYQTDMPDNLGVAIDVFGTINNNFEELITNVDNSKHIENVVNKFLSEGGNVYFGDHDNDASTPNQLYEIDVNGQKNVINIVSVFNDYLTQYGDTVEVKNILNEIKKYFGYDITSTVVSTGNKFMGKEILTFAGSTVLQANDAETSGVVLPNTITKAIKVYSIRLLDSNDNIVDVSITDIVYDLANKKLNFSVGSASIFYTPIPAGTYKVVVEFTEG